MLSFASLLQPCLEALSGKILHCRRVSLVIYIFRVNFVLELFGVDFSWYLSILLADLSALVSSYVVSEHWSTKLQLVLSSNFKPHQFQCKACLFSVFSAFPNEQCLPWKPFYVDQRPIWGLSLIDIHHQPKAQDLLQYFWTEIFVPYPWKFCLVCSRTVLAFYTVFEENPWIIIKQYIYWFKNDCSLGLYIIHHLQWLISVSSDCWQWWLWKFGSYTSIPMPSPPTYFWSWSN